MDTDVQGAIQVGYKAILVLSGVSKKEEVEQYAVRPHLIVEDVSQIELPLEW